MLATDGSRAYRVNCHNCVSCDTRSGRIILDLDATDDPIPGFDAVKQLILCRIERRPARLDLTAYPYLPKPSVGKTRAADYSALLEGAAA
jgi:hypothetical protein